MASPKASGSGAARLRSLAFSGSRLAQAIGEPRGAVLLTGFGPFPGVERNASAGLARELALIASRQDWGLRFIAEVLPVDWSLAPVRLQDLLNRHRPAVAVHFGVSPRATGFVVETLGYNAVKDAPDESGRLAQSSVLVAGDRPRRSATIPVRRIVRSLQAAGYPAELSTDPGRYLCNAVLYHSLRQAARTEPRTRTGFIHIPATLEPGIAGESSLMEWREAVEGGLRLMEEVVGTLRRRQSALS